MLTSTTTDPYTEIGTVASNITSDFSNPIILIAGLILAFLVIESILGLFYKGRGDYKGIYDE